MSQSDEELEKALSRCLRRVDAPEGLCRRSRTRSRAGRGTYIFCSSHGKKPGSARSRLHSRWAPFWLAVSSIGIGRMNELARSETSPDPWRLPTASCSRRDKEFSGQALRSMTKPETIFNDKEKMMNKRRCAWAVLLAGAIAAASTIADGQTSAPTVKDDLFAGTEKFAQGATSVTQIDMDPGTLGMVDGKDKARARQTVLSVVHTYEYDKPGLYRIEDVETFRKKLESGDWHCSVHTRELKTGESTDICNKRRSDEMWEQAVITVSPKSLTFIHTIRRSGPGGGGSELTMPLQMRLIEPDMAAVRAQIQAQMAIVRPEIQQRLEELKNFKGPNPAEIDRLRESLKRLDELKVEPKME